MPNILGIIPARAGSKRLPGKNKKNFLGKPLIKNIIDTALKSNLLDSIVVTTDDLEIIEYQEDYPTINFLHRPKAISGDNSPSIEYVNHALTQLRSKFQPFDIIVILQPTSPLTLAADIDATIKTLIDSKMESAVSVVKLDHAIHPIKMKTLKGVQLNPFLEEEKGRMAESELPEIYVRNCSVYATRIDVIRAGRIISESCAAYIMPRERSIDINDATDFKFAEFLVREQMQSDFEKGLSKLKFS
ncbi:MAG: cytidylyltransferase domain-containing protein [Bacteroidia bacterium]